MDICVKAAGRRNRGRNFGTLMCWLRLTCVLPIIFDFTTTVFSSFKSMKESSMTTDAATEALQRSKAAGMNGYITKPIDPSQLVTQLQEFLEQ